MVWTAVGVVAAVLTSLGFVPQIVKILRTKSAGDINRGTLVQFALGVILWLSYGVHIQDSVVIGANVVTLVAVGLLLWLQGRYGSAQRSDQ